MNKVLFGDVLYIKGRIGWQALKKDEYLTDGDYYLVTGVDITDEHRIDFSKCYYVDKDRYELDDKIQLKNGDIIVTKDGTIGKIALIENLDKPATLNSHLFLIRNLRPDIIDTHYLFYIFQSEHFKKYATNNTSGSNIPAFTQKNISEFEIDLPDIEVQRKVADILKQIDDKIINNNAINTELAAMAKTIYDYWFLQFEFPDENGKPYKSSGGKMVWNEKLKKEIPERWKCRTLAHYILEDKGGDWGKENSEGNYTKKVVCLRGADFPSITGNSSLEAPTRYILEKNLFKVLKHGDLIIEISGGSPTQSTGRICYINDMLLKRFETDIITSNFCKAISLNDKGYLYWFYMQWKTMYDNNVLFKYEGKTTGIKNLLFESLIKDYEIAMPSEELIIKYNDKVSDMFDKIQQNQKENQELASLRDFLLPLLMNGQVTFKGDS